MFGGGNGRANLACPVRYAAVIPRVGETMHLAGGSAGKVAEVQYDLAPMEAPIDVTRIKGSTNRVKS